MPSIARTGEAVVTGHECDTTTTLDVTHGNSSNVYSNGLGIACLGDPTVEHLVKVGDSCVPHVATITSASGSVFINGIAVARTGDACDSGYISSGSGNVFVGG